MTQNIEGDERALISHTMIHYWRRGTPAVEPTEYNRHNDSYGYSTMTNHYSSGTSSITADDADFDRLEQQQQQQQHYLSSGTTMIEVPAWLIELHYVRKRLFLRVIEPIIILLCGPMQEEGGGNGNDDNAMMEGGNDHSYEDEFRDTLPNYYRDSYNSSNDARAANTTTTTTYIADAAHRRLSVLPAWVANYTAHSADGGGGNNNDSNSWLRTTSMSFATLTMMYIIMFVILLVFLSCFYHNQKTSPLFVSPRRHRLPKLVPPPLPVDGAFSWVKVCLLISDEEVREEQKNDADIT